ncbi:MAG: cysteine--1-D-myo-inosityl 2-amino-2-deoxy-alpha-D-glucopyranoside ligase [Nocardioides sp.]|uniref:cysteine--1-D-myo-inosityl 2-amino-2-deoxy-alpha-D-glucopyranoside ligase n=1 Tax=Nocardioides sp. TaxID=35761 RepID=UPI0039E6A923
MRSWPAPDVPRLPVTGPPVRLFDSASHSVVATAPEDAARLYVCGITPYDATHLGHAATYVAFDLLNRAWRAAGHSVRYVQNVTDVDDPLLERATRDGIDWRELAERETELFRQDMAALRVLPPDEYVGVTESLPLVIAEIEQLAAAGATYRVDDDVYYSVASDASFGEVSGMLREEMLHVFPERGGDPDRPGKRDPLDALLWRGERPGEPSWESPFGPGRPGWHIECSAIALEFLGPSFDVQGGGSDLVFPHHEMSAAHSQAVRPQAPFARAYVHAGMVGYDGEKMSKSRGNLVFVSRLRNDGADPMAIRLALLAEHYRSDWEWTDAQLTEAQARLDRWRAAASATAGAPAEAATREVLEALADDLDAPRAVAAIDVWAEASQRDTASAEAPGQIRTLVDAALGVRL